MGEEGFRIKSGMTNEEIAGQARNDGILNQVQDDVVHDDDKKATGVCQLPSVSYVIQELRN